MIEHCGDILSVVDGSEVINCKKCGFIHIYPFPINEEVENLYTEEYYTNNKPEYIKKGEADKEWLEYIYRSRVNQIKKYLGEKENIKGIDIGSGPGYFLRASNELGWDITGYEPSNEAYFYSKSFGLKVENSFFNRNSINSKEKYDFIHTSHVLEHIPDVEETIKAMNESLKMNGLVYIVVPNDFNPIQNLLVEQYNYRQWWISPKEHINYFCFNTMENLLRRNGFEILEKNTSFPMELFLMMDENYVDNSNLGSMCHKRRKAFELKLYKNNMENLLHDFYKSFAENGLGRDVIIIAKKIS